MATSKMAAAKIRILGIFYDENLVTRVMTDTFVKRTFTRLLLVQKRHKTSDDARYARCYSRSGSDGWKESEREYIVLTNSLMILETVITS